MPRFDRITDDSLAARRPAPGRPGHVALDERFVALLIPESPLDQVESQELRQIVLAALQALTAQELKVFELRYQHKRSPGAVASCLHLSRDEVSALERRALDKLRQPLVDYMES